MQNSGVAVARSPVTPERVKRTTRLPEAKASTVNYVIGRLPEKATDIKWQHGPPL
jgi:hypothetical protein